MVANTGKTAHRSLTAPGVGAEEASRLVMAVLGEQADLSVHEVAPGRISVARARRPTWAVVACVATIWLAGLGLLFLLVRQTESGELLVTDGPRGCLLVVPPLVGPAVVRSLDDAIRSAPAFPRPQPALAALATAPYGTADDLDEHTVARVERAAPEPPTPPPPPAPPGGAELRFGAGMVQVQPGTPVVLGRDPSPTGSAEGLVVPGDASTVSKSHLLVAFDGTVATVEDLGSTNGSWVHRPDGPEALQPGRPAMVGDGARITIGSVTFDLVVRAAS